jgi:hypothetical protein
VGQNGPPSSDSLGPLYSSRPKLRFHGELYGWEAQFLERGELLISHGGFVLRELAVQWAEEERKAMEKAGA